MEKIKFHLIFTLLIFLYNTLLSDIAPTPYSYSGVPFPSDPSDSLALNRDPFSYKESFVDVSMVAETVFVDLYPTFLKVKVIFQMKGGKVGGRNLTAGFPENIYKRFASHPLYNFKIMVNDKQITPYYHADKIYDHIPSTFWWLFNLNVPPDKNVKVDISYYQLLFNKHSYSNSTRESFLDDTTEFKGGYILRTGALWKGNIGHAKIKLASHGEIEKYLTITPTPHKSTNNVYEWEYYDWNPNENINIRLNLPNKYMDNVSSGNAPYTFENVPPRIQFIDRLIRFDRRFFHTEEKVEDLIAAIVNAANQNDDYELKIYAHKILEFYQTHMKEYTNELFQTWNPDTSADGTIISRRLEGWFFDTETWDDLDYIIFNPGTHMGKYLHSISRENALMLLTPQDEIELDTTFTKDRLYIDGFERFITSQSYRGSRSSEFGNFGLVTEDLFYMLRLKYRTKIMVVLGLIALLFLVIIYFTFRLLKIKFGK